MNYRLKYANQIVSIFVLVALVALIGFIVLIAIKQKAFETKLDYYTHVSDATGLSPQTQLLFKGFEIGRVKSFSLNPDGWIKVHLIIFQKYKHLFTKDSVINRLTNPLTQKTQLEFVQNLASKVPIKEEEFILSTDTAEGLKRYRQLSVGKSSDMITSILANVDRLVQELGKDNNADKGALFRFLYHLANVSAESERSIKQVNQLLKDASLFVGNMNRDNNADQGALFRVLYNAAEMSEQMRKEVQQIENLLKTLNQTAIEYQQPDSLLIKMVDPTGQNLLLPIKGVIKSLDENLKETQELLKFFNRQKPEIATMVGQINTSLEKAQKTMEALNNNPLLKSGVPQTGLPSTGTGYRLKELPDDK
jgi:phospholipid/cholesterol/gamma-HCH transport system substrate-binding protein